jgi:hypothetical protein
MSVHSAGIIVESIGVNQPLSGIADCGLRIADCGFMSLINYRREIEIESCINPQSVPGVDSNNIVCP